MIHWIEVSMLDKSIKSIFLIGMILLVRKQFNLRSFKWANTILWGILFIYLLMPYSLSISTERMESFRWIQWLLQPILRMNESIRIIAKQSGSALSAINRIVVAFLLLCYVLYQSFKMNRILRSSQVITKDDRITECEHLFRFRRRIRFLTNDEIQVPITYGLIHPKVILTSCILNDDELLRHVLIHELTHIQKFDIIWNHLKYFVACLYWYNLLILSIVKYIEDDLEVLCDKLVVQKIGDTQANRKQYCASMLKLIEQNDKGNKLVLALHPTMERMIVMKKWRLTRSGTVALMLAMSLSIIASADIRPAEAGRVVASAIPSESYINRDSRVEVITKDESQYLMSKKDIGITPFKADIREITTLSGLENKQYKFNMKTWTTAYHDGFVIKLSDVSCSGGIDYGIIIQEDNQVTYKATFDRAVTLAVKAYANSKYKVTIVNHSIDPLKYSVEINSYIR